MSCESHWVWRWVLTCRIWDRSVIQISAELSMSERASKLNMQQTSNWTRPLWSRNLRLRPSSSSWAWESPWWKTRKLALTVAAKKYLQRLSIIWTSPLSDANRVKATNQFAFLVLTYPMWTLQWPLGELQSIDRETRSVRMVGDTLFALLLFSRRPQTWRGNCGRKT